jgi:two-component system, cell cycle sensor histidine kinase and response regulator CckA
MEPSGTPLAPPARHMPNSAERCVLVVDDDPSVLAVTARIVRDAGYVAVEAPSAREALRLLERNDPPINLVITDVVMPETDGRVLGRLIAERHAGLPVAYMSAYAADDVLHRGSPGPDVPFLSKPFSAEALVALVNQLLAAASRPGQALSAEGASKTARGRLG